MAPTAASHAQALASGEEAETVVYHSWQHVLDPEAFLEQARPILQLYIKDSEAIAGGRGFWIVCADEKTSIQARQGEHLPNPAAPEHSEHTSHRYQRQGALNLFDALSVADGQTYGLCQLRKQFADSQTFLLEAIIPEALRRGCTPSR